MLYYFIGWNWDLWSNPRTYRSLWPEYPQCDHLFRTKLFDKVLPPLDLSSTTHHNRQTSHDPTNHILDFTWSPTPAIYTQAEVKPQTTHLNVITNCPLLVNDSQPKNLGLKMVTTEKPGDIFSEFHTYNLIWNYRIRQVSNLWGMMFFEILGIIS